MNLQQIIEKLDLKVITTPKNLAFYPTGGYASDLLSCVMAGSKPGYLWVTLQSHINIIAVASLTDTCAIIITENSQPEPDVIAKAIEQGVTLLGTPENTYNVVGKLWEMGVGR
jgi:hypothetical protein